MAGRWLDLTRGVKFEAADAAVVTVDDRGLIFPKREGKTEILVRRSVGNDGAEVVRIPVEVREFARPAPVLLRARHHAAGDQERLATRRLPRQAEGQNGFKLSVFGFDPQATTMPSSRKGAAAAYSSLRPNARCYCSRPTSKVRTAAGGKSTGAGRGFQLLRRWIAEGAEFGQSAAGEAIAIEVEPLEQFLAAGRSQQLRRHGDCQRRLATLRPAEAD